MRRGIGSATRCSRSRRRTLVALLAALAGACTGPGSGVGRDVPAGEFGRLRRVDVAVTPANSGTVSDSIDGSAVDACSACRQRYRAGTEVVFTAQAAPDFVFDRWQGGVCDGSSALHCRFAVADSGRVTAIFRSAQQE